MQHYKQIFLIDDDEIFIFVMRKLLQKSGNFSEVVHINNGLDAVAELVRLQKNKLALPEIIFLDLNMPVLDGWQFLEAIEKLPFKAELAIYVISSSIDPQDRVRAQRYSCVRTFMPKPVALSWLQQL